MFEGDTSWRLTVIIQPSKDPDPEPKRESADEVDGEWTMMISMAIDG